jgi:putative transposase
MKTGYKVAPLLAYVTGLVNEDLLLQVEYLAAENRILRAQAPARLRLSDGERFHSGRDRETTRAKGSGNSHAQVAKPDTILGWWRKLVAQKFDGSRQVA